MGNFDTFKSLKRWFFGPCGVVRPSKSIIFESVPFEVTQYHFLNPSVSNQNPVMNLS